MVSNVGQLWPKKLSWGLPKPDPTKAMATEWWWIHMPIHNIWSFPNTFDMLDLNVGWLLVGLCGWLFQDHVEIHTKAKQAFFTLTWMRHQQRIKEYNRTRCTRVVDRSKIVLRYTPKPNMPSASCHGCTRCLEKRQRNISETANCELKCVTLC